MMPIYLGHRVYLRKMYTRNTITYSHLFAVQVSILTKYIKEFKKLDYNTQTDKRAMHFSYRCLIDMLSISLCN